MGFVFELKKERKQFVTILGVTKTLNILYLTSRKINQIEFWCISFEMVPSTRKIFICTFEHPVIVYRWLKKFTFSLYSAKIIASMNFSWKLYWWVRNSIYSNNEAIIINDKLLFFALSAGRCQMDHWQSHQKISWNSGWV